MKERWDDDDNDVMTRSQPQLPPGRPCHALLWLPAGGSEEPELTSDGLMRAGGGGQVEDLGGKQWYDVMSSGSDYQSRLNSSLANISSTSR